MTANETLNNTGSTPMGCQVVILYESQEALTRAKEMCERIMVELWEDMDIQLAHWAMDLLAQDPHAKKATDRAAVADVLVVAAKGTGEFPPEFSNWIDHMVAQRRRHEGALVGLFNAENGNPGEPCSWDIRLHQLALRAGMDYLNHLPHSPRYAIPDATNWCTSRAETFTGTLDEILHSNPRP